ncbi:CBS domain-containing protein [Myxococcota bacterium]|nr:CBS domain-containing protein [Myxococcota bacterium]
MKIAFFLTPKAEAGWIWDTVTVRQAIEKLENHGFTAVPILTREGHYVATLTEGDVLWFLRHRPKIRFEDLEKIPISEVPIRRSIRAIRIDAEIEQLVSLTLDQSFVPVVDDREVFIGIVRRRTILAHFRDSLVEALRYDTGSLPP